MRNAVILPNDHEGNLIITTDNCGGIGQKEGDEVQAAYEVVSYHSFRVAVMECIAAGGEPVSVIVQNFCGEEAWADLVKGVEKGLAELEMDHVSISGSTESNFQLEQSAVGIVVIGRGRPNHVLHPNGKWAAVIGTPLVGHEVIDQHHKSAPLALFKRLASLDEVYVWPVGSKGILNELKKMSPAGKLTDQNVESDLDLHKSAGPSSCFITVYPAELHELITDLTGDLYHSLKITT